MTMARLFFFVEAVLTQGASQLNFGDTSKLDEPLFLLLFGSACRALYPKCKGPWDGGVVTEEMFLLRRAGTYGYCPLLLKSPCSASVLCVKCPVCLSGLSQGR